MNNEPLIAGSNLIRKEIGDYRIVLSCFTSLT
jgi:hypothetical protein